MSKAQYELQASALQNEINRLDAEVDQAKRASVAAAKEFATLEATTPRRDRNWLFYVLRNGDRDARERYLAARREAGTSSSRVERIVRDRKTADRKLSELVVDGLRRYDDKYGEVEKELHAIREVRTACERTLGAVAVARRTAEQAARSAPQRSRRGEIDPEVEQVAARVSAAVQVVRDGVADLNKARGGVGQRFALAGKFEFSDARVDRSKRVSEFTRVGNALTALEKDVRSLRSGISEKANTLESELRQRRETERERVRSDASGAQ